MRLELGQVIEAAECAWAAGEHAAAGLLLEALAFRAEDARYGAGQLSRGSQRAPTVADIEDGWVRVEEIVQTAEAAADRAEALCEGLDDRKARRWAEAARTSATAARAIVDARNHAYTFHADPSFSFGEGWYLSAAAALSQLAARRSDPRIEPVTIQVEPNQAQTAAVERFLREAGLSERVVPARPRPRANKPLTDIVARGFRAFGDDAVAAVRRALVGAGPLLDEVVAWAEAGLEGAPEGPKVLLWVRYARHHPHRNTTFAELSELARFALEAGVTPILVGDALRDGDAVPSGAVDWTLFWKQALFQGEQMRRAQLHLFEHLRRDHRLIGQTGVTTAGMDGPALSGLPTMYLTQPSNPRMRAWVGAVPGYEEVVRDEGYLDQVVRTLERWRDTPAVPAPIDEA